MSKLDFIDNKEVLKPAIKSLGVEKLLNNVPVLDNGVLMYKDGMWQVNGIRVSNIRSWDLRQEHYISGPLVEATIRLAYVKYE